MAESLLMRTEQRAGDPRPDAARLTIISMTQGPALTAQFTHPQVLWRDKGRPVGAQGRGQRALCFGQVAKRDGGGISRPTAALHSCDVPN